MDSSAPAILLGLDPLWLSTAIFVATYALLISERVHRTVAAMLGAGLMILSGIITQDDAFDGVDFNTISLLTGSHSAVVGLPLYETVHLLEGAGYPVYHSWMTRPSDGV